MRRPYFCQAIKLVENDFTLRFKVGFLEVLRLLIKILCWINRYKILDVLKSSKNELRFFFQDGWDIISENAQKVYNARRKHISTKHYNHLFNRRRSF